MADRKDKMKLSVIVPFYNRVKTAARCLDSLLAASVDEMEIIAVDDGSADETWDILKHYSSQDNRIKVIRQTNKGPSAARNRGLEAASGEFVAFCDSDDRVHPEIYRTMLAEQQKYNADVVICGLNIVYASGNKTLVPPVSGGDFKQEVSDHIIRQFYGGDPACLAGMGNKIYRRKLIESNNMRFDESLHRGEDWWFNLHVYENADSVALTGDALYYYCREGGDSIMKRMELEYYFQWKDSSKYLMRKNDELYHFDIDYDRFYGERLANIHELLLYLTMQGESIAAVQDDEFYNSIISYDKLMSVPVRICHKLHRISLLCEKTAYKLLALYHKLKLRRGK